MALTNTKSRDGFELGADELLVERYRSGEAEAIDALLDRYRSFTRMKAHAYFLAGADREDIIQEGMIGLYKAIRDYDPDRRISFRSFAEVCITRQIITAVKMASRRKHQPLNSYVSLQGGPSGSDGPSLEEVVPTREISDPLDLIIAGEEIDTIRFCFAEILSEFEIRVLHLYMEGRTYASIGAELGRTGKSIDNALQRVKRKVEQQLREFDLND